MNNSRRLLTNRRITLVALTFAAALSLAPPSAGSPNSCGQEKGQDEDAVLETPWHFNSPVQITLVRSHAGVIEPGRKFPAGEDWFNGLAFTLLNKAEQPVRHVSLRIVFPRPKGQEGELDFAEVLIYGESPIPYPDGRIPVNTAAPILPGESVDLRLSDADYEGLRAMLAESKFPRHIRRLRVNIDMIEFGDGTIWRFGRKYVWNKDTRDKLIPLEKKQSAAPGRVKFVKARARSE